MRILLTMGCVRLADYSDLYSKDRKLKINNLVFVGDKKPECVEVLQGDETNNIILQLLYYDLCFMLCRKDHPQTKFCFRMALRQADEMDVLHSTGAIKLHTIYYVLGKGDTIYGPTRLDENINELGFREQLEKKMIYVIHHKQDFEEIQLSLQATG